MHCAAVEGAVLDDDTLAVDANDVAVGEGVGDGLGGFVVEVGLSVGRVEHGIVDNEEVGVGGRQTLAVAIDGSGHGQT